MSISVDRDWQSWENFLAKNPDLPGEHFFAIREGERIPMWSDYRLWSVPRYLLIDHEGKIIDSHAPWPSSVEIGKLIDGALARMPA